MNILGRAEVKVQDAVTWARRKGATEEFISLADIYWDTVAASTGCRPEVLFAQAAKETGFGRFGGVINASFKNPCGLKTTRGGSDSDPNAHQRFPDWLSGCTAQGDHLALYAGQKNYPRANTPDPRHFPFLLGKAGNSVEALGGAWAPSRTYGNEIVAMVREMPLSTPAPAPTPAPTPAPSAAPPFVTRAQWDARPPRNRQPQTFTGIRVHYSGADSDEQADHKNCAGRVKGIQNYHIGGQGWADIAYSFLVCRHGVVFEGRGWDARTAANGTNACNSCCLAVCFLGDDSIGRDDVTDAGRRALAWVLQEAARRGASNVGGHRDCIATTCPGDELYNWVKSGAWKSAPAPAPTPQPAPRPLPPITVKEVVMADAKAVRVAVRTDAQGNGWRRTGQKGTVLGVSVHVPDPSDVGYWKGSAGYANDKDGMLLAVVMGGPPSADVGVTLTISA